MMKLLLFFSSIVFLGIVLYAYGMYTESSSSIMACKIDTYVKEWEKEKLFSGAILVAREGNVIFRKGYGMANYELDVENTPDTKFRLGSITKQFTAFAIVQLEKNGLLSFDDILDKYIPDYPRGSDITIKQLLMHTSGIVNFTSLSEYAKLELLPATLDVIIAIFKDKPLDFEPDLKFQYSNSGYILLTYIIEKASGQSYEQYLQEHIFKPFGMHNSGYDRAEVVLKNRASGYSLAAKKDDASESDEIIQNASYVNMQVPAGAGALYSTVNDLLIWDRVLHSGDKHISSLIESMVKMEADNEKVCTIEYGYGIFVNTDSFGHKKTISHNGGINGFATMMTHIVEDGIVIVVLSNFDFANTGRLVINIGNLVFGEEPQAITEKRNRKFKTN